ncbi:MAG: hypothetical protein ACKE51_09525 [Methylococcaceae bacterium]
MNYITNKILKTADDEAYLDYDGIRTHLFQLLERIFLAIFIPHAGIQFIH